MKTTNLATLILIVIGGLNWGLVGLIDFDVIGTIFGGAGSLLVRMIYIVVGLSALWQLVPLSRAFSTGEVAAERNIG
jgi:hypothetical protein